MIKKPSIGRKLGFLILIATASVQAQTHMVPIGALGQLLVGRNYIGVNPATGQPTGGATAALYLPYIAGIPREFMFSSATVHNETTAHFTAVFTPFTIENITTDGDMTNTFIPPGLEIRYYYHSQPDQNWNDYDSFQNGQLIAKFGTTENVTMISTVGRVQLVMNSAPMTFSEDFVLPDGNKYNFKRFVPGGLTAHVFESSTFITDPAHPGPPAIAIVAEIGGPAVMVPVSARAFHQVPLSLLNRLLGDRGEERR
jgi:hypothetical protein